MNSRALPVTLVALFGAAPALAALGGAAGVEVPYAGKLELNGVLATGSFDFQFQVMVDATTATACDTKTVSAVAVTNGEFAVTIPAVSEACVKGKDVHLIVSVRSAGGGAFTTLGKQRVAPTLAAMTTGTGDFHVGGAATVVGGVSAGGFNTGGGVTAGSVNTGGLTTGSTTFNTGTVITLNPTSGIFPWLIFAEGDGHLVFSVFGTTNRRVSFDGNNSGTIRSQGSILSNSTPDIAETIAAAKGVEAADVVCADPTSPEHAIRCARGAHGVLGVISDGTSAFLINSRAHDVDAPLNGQPLVLAGRVPVKVSAENGPIHIGDELTLSSTPGVAMRAEGPGPVVGIALGDFNDLHSKGPGTVLCLVKVAEANVAALARDNATLARDNAELKQRMTDLEAAVKHLAALDANAPQASR